MSHQQLPSTGTTPASTASGSVRLVWRHRNSKSLSQGQSEALLAGQVHTQVAEAGKLYRVVNAQDQIVTPEKAQRQGNHLVIVLKGNVQIVIQDFFAHTGKKTVRQLDSAGNFSANASLNSAIKIDTTAPTITSASAKSDKLILTFSEALSEVANFTPTASDFSLSSAGGRTVTGVSVTGNTVVLTLSSAYAFQENVGSATVSYTNSAADATDIQDVAGNEAASMVSRAYTNDTPNRPVISAGQLAGVNNLDIRSNIVLSLSETGLSLVPGKKIKIINDGNYDGTETMPAQGYSNNEQKYNDIEIVINAAGATTDNTKVFVQEQDPNSATYARTGTRTEFTPMGLNNAINTNVSSVQIVGDKLVINPCYDLDLSNRYHIEVEAGALVNAGSLGNEAITSGTAIAFNTVIPKANANNANTSANRSGNLSVKLDDTGALVNSYNWVDLEGRGTFTKAVPAHAIFDAGGSKKFAYVLSDSGPNPGLYTLDLMVRIYNFGSDDVIYFDNQTTIDAMNPIYGDVALGYVTKSVNPWDTAMDYVNVSAAGVGQIATEATQPTWKREVARFSPPGFGQIWLSLDPSEPGTLPAGKTIASAGSAPKSVNEVNQYLNNGEVFNFGVTPGGVRDALGMDPNNSKLHIILG